MIVHTKVGATSLWVLKSNYQDFKFSWRTRNEPFILNEYVNDEEGKREMKHESWCSVGDWKLKNCLMDLKLLYCHFVALLESEWMLARQRQELK